MALFLSPEKRQYYLLKRRKQAREEEASRVIKEDAVFIKHYGMSAYLTLFPEAKDFGMKWHRAVIKELQKLEKQKLANEVTGQYLAVGATKHRKLHRLFNKLLRSLRQ